MSRPIPLDLASPMRSLREAAGLTIAQMARARGVPAPSIHDSERTLPRLATLLSAAALLGLDVEIRVRKAE